jgi:hypothetical protein
MPAITAKQPAIELAWRTDHLHYSWDQLRPAQRLAARHLLDTARVVAGRRRRRRTLVLSSLIAACVVAGALALYVLFIVR